MTALAQKPLPSTKSGLTRETSYVYTPPSHRLLFRGSLSVPGSRILLEGLTFTVPLKASPAKLLDNPLALALESMRGRTLALSGITRLDAIYLDKTTEINLDIHPAACLSRLYFENQLCTEPITAKDGCTDVGVRVTLGDSENENTSDIVIYGKLPDVPMFDSNEAPPLQLLVARVLPAPLAPPVRLPRPDDPSPRVPPLAFFGKKRIAGADAINDTPSHKRQKNARSLAREDSVHTIEAYAMPKAKEALPVAPALPNTRERPDPLSRSASIAGDDVFRVPDVPVKPVADNVPDIAKELEKANKATVKRATVDCLTTFGVTKEHAEYKDIYQLVYRGTEFAMRSQMRSRAVDMRTVDKFLRVHGDMYIRGVAPRGK